MLKDIWPGKNRFPFGRCITGPSTDIPYNACAWISIILISSLYFAFLGLFLLQQSPILLTINILFLIFTISFKILTSFTDPGNYVTM
jgi:hypothetical protein